VSTDQDVVIIGVGTSLLGSFALVVAGMAVYGFGSAICDVAMNVEGAGVEKAIGKTIMPLFHASWSAGMVVGTTIGTALVFAHVDILVHTIGLAVLLLLGAALAPRAIPRVATHAETGEEVAHVSFRDRMSIWLEPRTLAIGLIALGMAFTEGSANDWLALGMVDDRGLDNGQGAALFTVFTASMTVVRLVGTRLLDRFGRVWVLRASGTAAFTGLLLFVLAPSFSLAVVGVSLWGLGAALAYPVTLAAASDDPVRAAARVSVVTAFASVARLCAPPAIGRLGEAWGIRQALVIIAGGLVLSVLLAYQARKEKPADGELPATVTPEISQTTEVPEIVTEASVDAEALSVPSELEPSLETDSR